MAVVRRSGVPLIVAYSFFEFLASVAVLLRFISIRIRRRPIKAHDYLCVLAFLCTTAYSIDYVVATVDGGIGEHIGVVSMGELKIALKVLFSSEFFWTASTCAFRISILLLYCDIFDTRKFKITAYIFIGIVSAFGLGSYITIFSFCRPLRYNWDRTIQGTCGSLAAEEIVSYAIHAALDVCIVFLPVPLVLKLHMPLRKKAGIIATFALGLVIFILNIIRIVIVVECDSEDFTYCSRNVVILSTCEMTAGIIVACIPTMGPVLFPGRFGPTANKPGRPAYTDDLSGNYKPRSDVSSRSKTNFTRSSEEIDLTDTAHLVPATALNGAIRCNHVGPNRNMVTKEVDVSRV